MKDPDERHRGDYVTAENEDYTERATHINKLVFAGTLAAPWSFAYYHRENRRLLKRDRPLVSAATSNGDAIIVAVAVAVADTTTEAIELIRYPRRL